MNDTPSLERARAALSYLDPSCSREEWVKWGMALKSEFGNDAFEIWDAWSAISDKYNPRSARQTWKSFRDDGKIKIGSLFFDAKQSGWKDDAKYKKPTAAEIAERKKAAEERQAIADALQAESDQNASVIAQKIWDAAKPCESHPYLNRKGVKSHGLRVGRWEYVDSETGEVKLATERGLLIPMCDRNKKIWSLQCIDPNPDGPKMYLRDGAKKEHFFPIGSAASAPKHKGKTVFVLAEGYATGASVHEATGYMVLVCFDVGNVRRVAYVLRERQPNAIILFALDNDTHDPKNPGVTYGTKAAIEVGGLVALPPPGDFNDLFLTEGGPDMVSYIIAEALDSEPPKPPQPPQPPAPPQPKQPEPPAPLPPKAEEESAPADSASEPHADALLAGGDDDYLVDAGGHFTILGYDGDDYFFFHHAKKQVLCRRRGDFSDMGFAELAPTNWWEMYFPAKSGKGGIDRVMAFEWIVSVAHKRGIYDPSRTRGRGAWLDNGRSVFHHGDYLSVDGKRVEIAGIESKWVYPMAHAMPAVVTTPATDADGEHLLSVAKMVRWSRQGSAALLAGWVFLAPIGGALKWRPHVWITGAAGSGKSTIFSDFVEPLVRDIGCSFQGDSSEAGIRQTLRADAIPALIDEFEPNDEKDRARMKNVLTMIRQSSSETAAQTAKGSLSGDAVRYHIRSMFCLVSINTMLEKDSDKTRISPLTILPPVHGSERDQKKWLLLEDEFHKIKTNGEWSSRLMSRALAMLPTISKAVGVFCSAASKHFGTQRAGDQYGTLLAGTWCLTKGYVPTEAEALAMIQSYDWDEHTSGGDGMDDPHKMLSKILSEKVKVKQTDVTIYELLCEVSGQSDSSASVGVNEAADELRRHGIRIEGNEVAFGVGCPSLKEILKDTPYATDPRGQLSRLPGAHNGGNKTRKFMGVATKAVLVPIGAVLGDVSPTEPPI